jgi:LPXTG-site transpeptidase (sortase) family protein
MGLYTSVSVPDPPAAPEPEAGPEIEAGPPRPDRAAAPEQPVVRRQALRAVLPIVVSVLVAFVVAAGYLMVRQPRGAEGLGRWGGSPSAATSMAPPSEDLAGAFRTVPSDLSGPPTRLRVRAIGVDTPLETLKLGTDGELQPPRTNDRAGWYAEGTAPGDVGPAVLAGHVDSKRGPAVFSRLREITAGDKIEVTRGARTVTFTVTSTAWYSKKAFPTDQVYGPTPDRQLRLITCGGVFDKTLRSYQDNLVVYAVAG